jgi:hypothetical protein
MKERFHDMLMNKDNDYRHPVPQDSYSRELDSRVQQSEMPYGYSTDSPPADTGDFNQRRLESNKQYSKSRGK